MTTPPPPIADSQSALTDILRECDSWLDEHEKSLSSGRPFIWNGLQCNSLRWKVQAARAALAAASAPVQGEPAAAPLQVSGATSDERSSIAIVMANVMFNFAQKCGYTLTSDDCALFEKLGKRCDAASLNVATPAAPDEQKRPDLTNEQRLTLTLAAATFEVLSIDGAEVIRTLLAPQSPDQTTGSKK